MTLLKYKKKYIVQSGNVVTTTSSTLTDDTEASQTFTLTGTQTVLVLYSGNSAHTEAVYSHGATICISVDGVNYSQVSDSPYATNYCTGNTTFWVGSLGAGSHTIKGKFAATVDTHTTTISNRTLLIMIFDGNEFGYRSSFVNVISNASYALFKDTASDLPFTPSAPCKALLLYATTNNDGDGGLGIEIAINFDGTNYGNVSKEPSYVLYALSNLAVAVKSATASIHTFCGYFRPISVSIGSGTIDKRYVGYLLLSNDTLIDDLSSSTPFSVTSSSLQDDTAITVSRTLPDARECFAFAKMQRTVDSAVTGERYGIAIDNVDAMSIRRSGANYYYTNSMVAFFSKTVSAAVHTVKGRLSNNTGTDSVAVSSREIIALWFKTDYIPQDISHYNYRVEMSYTTPAKWLPNHSYAAKDLCVPTTRNGYIYTCIVAGTSNTTTEPTWPTMIGEKFRENTTYLFTDNFKSGDFTNPYGIGGAWDTVPATWSVQSTSKYDGVYSAKSTPGTAGIIKHLAIDSTQPLLIDFYANTTISGYWCNTIVLRGPVESIMPFRMYYSYFQFWSGTSWIALGQAWYNPNAWYHCQVYVDFANATVNLVVDGQYFGSAPLKSATNHAITSNTVFTEIEIKPIDPQSSNLSDMYTSFIDDIIVRVQAYPDVPKLTWSCLNEDMYSLSLNVDNTTAANTTGNIHCNGACQDLTKDIRFTQNNKRTICPFYRESATGPWWVKVIAHPDYANCYIYYDKVGEKDGSDISSAFMFGDDFETDDLSKWDVGTWTVQPTIAKEGAYAAMSPDTAVAPSPKLRWNKFIGSHLIHGYIYKNSYSTYDVSGLVSHDKDSSAFASLRMSGRFQYYRDQSPYALPTDTYNSVNTWYKFDVALDLVNGLYRWIYVSNGNKGTAALVNALGVTLGPTTYFTDVGVVGEYYITNCNYYLDQFWVRNYVYPELAWSSAGAQTLVPSTGRRRGDMGF